MKTITVNDSMQQGYRYALSQPIGQNFDPRFKPDLSPQEMLELGVFGGVYMRDCIAEFPPAWFHKAKFQDKALKTPNSDLNFFEVDASQSLTTWRKRGWIHPQDPRGWFQWYCRYYMGRRTDDDERQIKRWLAMKRHVTQLQNNCQPCDVNCRPRQRQALLHWAYDSRNM